MTNCGQLTRPVVSLSASFDPDKATGQRLEKLQQLSAPNCSIEDDRTVRGDTVSFENVSTKIQSNCCNFNGGVPFLTEGGLLQYAVKRDGWLQAPTTPSASYWGRR